MLSLGIGLLSPRRRAVAPDPEPGFDPLSLFDGGYTGRLYDFRQSQMFSDDGVTPASIGGPVYRITDLTGGLNADQITG